MTTSHVYDPETHQAAITVGRAGLLLTPSSVTALAGMTLTAISDERFAERIALALLAGSPSDRSAAWDDAQASIYAFEDENGHRQTVEVGCTPTEGTLRLSDVAEAVFIAFEPTSMEKLLEAIKSMLDPEADAALGGRDAS